MSKFLDENGLLYLWGKIKTLVGGKVDKVEGKGLSTNDFTTAEKTKLDGLENYTLPAASADVLGGVKVGAGLAVNQGVLSATGGGTADSVDWSNVQNKPDLALKSDLTSVYRYKGSVQNYASLPTTGNAVGDVWVECLRHRDELRMDRRGLGRPGPGVPDRGYHKRGDRHNHQRGVMGWVT